MQSLYIGMIVSWISFLGQRRQPVVVYYSTLVDSVPSMSPCLHDSHGPPAACDSHIIELEPLLVSPNNSKNDIPQLSNPNETASRSSITIASSLEGTKSVAGSSTTLHRSVYVPVFVLGYTALAIFAWAVTCILSYRPITTDHYGVWLGKGHAYGWSSSIYIHSLFVKNEQWFSAARFIQSVVTVLTIPLTSAVCSKAAVIFIQHQSGLSLRQAMTLADKGWTEPTLYVKLMFGGLKRYGSSFLFLAILLNILGGIISPLQSLFLTSQTIKTPTWPGIVLDLTDILDPLDPVYTSNHDFDLIPILVRSAITSTSNADLQSGLWTSNPINCSSPTNKTESPTPFYCALRGITLGNMSSLPEPFLAQLPSGYNTGLIRQFLPRINSSATRKVITEADFPENCDTLPGSFYANYANSGEFGNWSLIACMPANQTHSPWKPVRTRQDFSEDLYLNLSVSGFWAGFPLPSKAQGGLFKITVNTTAGFFELPNYMNGQLPGPLLDDDPSNYCGLDCMSQGYLSPIYDHNLTSRSSLIRRDNTSRTNIISNTSLALEMSQNRGPLLTTAIALFGDGSFIADRVTHPEAYISNITDGECIGQAPLIGLLHDRLDQTQVGNILDPCISRTVKGDEGLQEQIAMYISSLYFNQWGGYDGEQIKNAFESAAFLSNQAWLQSSTISPTFTVSYDAGADTVVPTISGPGIILISALLAVDLFSLLAMAVYSAWTPSWTDQLDAFAMMRIGAAIAESLPFRVADTTDRIKFLDETPGWIGDRTEGKGEVGELGIGAPTPLRRRRKYACY